MEPAVVMSPRKSRGERIYGQIKERHSKFHELLMSIFTARGITKFVVEGRVDGLNFKLEIDLNDHANTIVTGVFGAIAFNPDSFFFRGLSNAKFAGKIKNGVAYLEIDSFKEPAPEEPRKRLPFDLVDSQPSPRTLIGKTFAARDLFVAPEMPPPDFTKQDYFLVRILRKWTNPGSVCLPEPHSPLLYIAKKVSEAETEGGKEIELQNYKFNSRTHYRPNDGFGNTYGPLHYNSLLGEWYFERNEIDNITYSVRAKQIDNETYVRLTREEVQTSLRLSSDELKNRQFFLHKDAIFRLYSSV